MEPMGEQFTIRAYALEQAVKLYANSGPSPTNPDTRNSEILKAAHRFEEYLAAPASDQQQHADTGSALAKSIS